MATSRRISSIGERLNQTREQTVFLRRVTRTVDDCVRLACSDNVPISTNQYCVTRLIVLQTNIGRARGSLMSEEVFTEMNQIVAELLEEFQKGSQEQVEPIGYTAQRSVPTSGSHCYDITKGQLSFLIHCGFTSKKISELLGVSLSTVDRRIRAFNLQFKTEYSSISDDELDHLIKQHLQGNKRIGPNAVRAWLFSQQYKVQRWRVRECMQRVDAGGAALRAAPSLQRRSYSVAGPNSLWHIDGNHKLIRWKIVIHGGIDGFSRMLVFLHASDNNRKETVADYFLTATACYGVPSRIRVDQGGENNEICQLMEFLRGPDRGSAIRGRSVHNQRIERNWVDLWNGVTNLYYDLFHFMEQSGHLDINNDTHLWALQYVYIPRVNKALERFVNQWNNHGLRTENHQSPTQLFVSGMLKLCNTGLTAMNNLFEVESTPDGEPDAQHVFEESEWDSSTVTVPSVSVPLHQDLLDRLGTLHSQLPPNDELGINTYLEVVEFINQNNR